LTVGCGIQHNRSLLHPRILGGVGILGRAAVLDGFGAQFVVPRFVAVDLAQSVLGTMFGQPRCGIVEPDVDGVSRHVRRCRRGGDPSGSFVERAVFGDGLAKELILVFGGTPAAIDEELDSVGRGIRCSLTEGLEQFWLEVGDSRNLVIENRDAVSHPSGLVEHPTVLTARRRWCIRGRQ
jgi:hypothetical protein